MSINIEAQQSAKQAALTQVQLLQNLIPPTVSYTTEGNVLIIGAEDLARLAAERLSAMNQLTILATESISCQDDDHLEKVMNAAEGVPTYYAKLENVKGFLGQFQAQVILEDGQHAELSKVSIRKPHFDLILDLSIEPVINLEMLPPGYLYVGQDAAKLDDAIEQLPNLIGEFSKPRYIKVNAEICAHYRNGNNGCNRCVNFCPADAISSKDQVIEIDPYLCHGAGSCSNACPTGALAYDSPSPESLHKYIAGLIAKYREISGGAPNILFYDLSQQEALAESLPANVIPVALEEVTVAGIDHWFAALAGGAQSVGLLTTSATPDTLLQYLQGEVSLAQQLLQATNDSYQISLIAQSELEQHQWPEAKAIEPALQQPVQDNKRSRFYQALDALNAQGKASADALSIANLPYGKISVKAADCTLCLSCVSTCPTAALQDGGDQPLLSFREQDCIQCGLCEQACPEKVISLASQVHLDAEARQARQVMKEEKPFECITCGKPFATQSMVNKMMEMVGAHSAFAGHTNRLQMCEDCRTKDLFQDILKDPERQLR
ncbi:4Fe-4S binding protein [Paraferrimonas sedimenticola]|uniref:4Fe-4S ferredoxin n=1 Tax=Paraferrimonas sedimenticola TaxID=375674 RepID=A0AA37RXI9_9GAMM|nr:4Fe-4S binding protein [Paraferrimonas sedimenticola]GLP97550.1 4Fe-4S ferredoxin [Paraferrimonas sedimenticola]